MPPKSKKPAKAAKAAKAAKPAKAVKPAKAKAGSKVLEPAQLELNVETMVGAARERRKALTFDAKNAGGGKSPTAYEPAALYGIAAHGGSSSEVPHALDALVRPLVDFAQINPTLLQEGALRHPWELYFQAFLDGYAALQAVTAAPPKGPKKIGSKGAVTQFVKSAIEKNDVALSGALAPIFEALLGEYLTLHGQGLRKPTAAAFVTGANLRCLECGVELQALQSPKKERGAAIPKGKATPHEELLSAVLANPDDDAPRLVYADYLTTHNDPLGEFISLQCKVRNVAGYEEAYPPEPVEDEERLIKRIDTLLKASRGKWFDGVKLQTVSYARGFPVNARAEASEFLGNEKIDRIPLETIRLNHWNAKFADAAFKRAKHPTLKRFWFGTGFGPKTVHLLAAPVFADAVAIESSFWEEGELSPRALELLGKTEFKNLELVDGLDELFDAIARAKCPRLHTWRTGNWNVRLASTTALWRQLKRLDVFNLAEAADVSPLASAQSLERLTVRNNELGEAGVRRLLEVAPKSLKTVEGSFRALPPELTSALSARFELREATD